MPVELWAVRNLASERIATRATHTDLSSKSKTMLIGSTSGDVGSPKHGVLRECSAAYGLHSGGGKVCVGLGLLGGDLCGGRQMGHHKLTGNV